MDFIDKIRELAARVSKQLEHIQTEEATKNALIMPFIAALGYNVFDPTEVTPELNADVGIKKGEKVDYAILRDSKPIILFECKHHATDLSKIHASQLYRYFSVTTARFGVLTNGIVYWFFTDLEAPNKMDAKPFFEFNLLDIKEQAVEELKKFTKSAFDLNNILTTASELKYMREIRRIMAEQMQEPSDEFVKFFAAQVYQGRMTQAVREQFAQFTRQALKQFINDQINDRLKTALASDAISVADKPAEVVPSSNAAAETPTPESEALVVTTAEELDGFYIVKAILREVVDVKRIVMRDVQSYCGILLDDNNRKPICRLHFNASQKYVSFFDDQKDTRVPIAQVDDLYKHADRLKATVARYETKGAPQKVSA
jgi:predicted type IV restriction endonuclease